MLANLSLSTEILRTRYLMSGILHCFQDGLERDSQWVKTISSLRTRITVILERIHCFHFLLSDSKTKFLHGCLVITCPDRLSAVISPPLVAAAGGICRAVRSLHRLARTPSAVHPFLTLFQCLSGALSCIGRFAQSYPNFERQ